MLPAIFSIGSAIAGGVKAAVDSRNRKKDANLAGITNVLTPLTGQTKEAPARTNPLATIFGSALQGLQVGSSLDEVSNILNSKELTELQKQNLLLQNQTNTNLTQPFGFAKKLSEID